MLISRVLHRICRFSFVLFLHILLYLHSKWANLSAAVAADRSHCDLSDFWSKRTNEECSPSHSPCNRFPIPGIQQRDLMTSVSDQSQSPCLILLVLFLARPTWSYFLGPESLCKISSNWIKTANAKLHTDKNANDFIIRTVLCYSTGTDNKTQTHGNEKDYRKLKKLTHYTHKTQNCNAWLRLLRQVS